MPDSYVHKEIQDVDRNSSGDNTLINWDKEIGHIPLCLQCKHKTQQVDDVIYIFSHH